MKDSIPSAADEPAPPARSRAKILRACHLPRAKQPAPAWVMSAISSLEQFVSGQMQSTVELALRSGLSAEKVIELQGRALQPALDTALPAAARAGFASATEGFWALTRTEGGCISVEEARALLRGGSSFTRQAVHDRIKKNKLIAAKIPSGQYAIARWQFAADGTVLNGIPEALRALQEDAARYSPLSAFAFFLQPAPSLDNETPLRALKAGNLEAVLEAAADFGRR